MLAQASPEGVLDTILNYGPFGIILVLLLLGWLFPKPMIDHLLHENERLRKDNEKVRDENRALRTGIEEKVTPALVRVTDVLNRLSERGLANGRRTEGGP